MAFYKIFNPAEDVNEDNAIVTSGLFQDVAMRSYTFCGPRINIRTVHITRHTYLI